METSFSNLLSCDKDFDIAYLRIVGWHITKTVLSELIKAMLHKSVEDIVDN